MSALSDFFSRRARRPYWLLLALALFCAGQVAIASHWHHDSALNDNSSLDIDCALCVLSSAAGAALATHAVVMASIVLCAFIFFAPVCVVTATRVSAYDSRAPPRHS